MNWIPRTTAERQRWLDERRARYPYSIDTPIRLRYGPREVSDAGIPCVRAPFPELRSATWMFRTEDDLQAFKRMQGEHDVDVDALKIALDDARQTLKLPLSPHYAIRMAQALVDLADENERLRHEHSFPLSTGVCACGAEHPTLGPKRCLICRRPLDQPGDPDSIDCGGDCAACVREAEGRSAHPCQRCGSEEWTEVSYSGCTVCRPEAFTRVDAEEVKDVTAHSTEPKEEGE